MTEAAANAPTRQFATTMHEFWFISVPISGNLTNTHLNLKNKLHDAADVSLFSIPVFKIGTLDALVVMSDDLAKFDLAFEQSTLKISDILRTLLRNAQTDLNSQLTVNEKSVDQYIKTFEWNTTKYRIDKSLQEITELLNQ
ncbi:ATPase, V1 complex, subunit C, partial [Jimgerdemannia flammicorona]